MNAGLPILVAYDGVRLFRGIIIDPLECILCLLKTLSRLETAVSGVPAGICN